MAISAAFPFEPHYVDVEGVRMHYVEQGRGDPILFRMATPPGLTSGATSSRWSPRTAAALPRTWWASESPPNH